MKPIFYIGCRLKVSLLKAFSDAGLTVTRLSNEQGLQELQRGSPCSTVLLEWRSKRNQIVIKEAYARRIPVLVLTSRLADAVLAAEPSADVYLERPCPDQEVVSLALDLIHARPLKLAFAAAAGRTQAVDWK
jgi:DNA-binding response OmpR family regulator